MPQGAGAPLDLHDRSWVLTVLHEFKGTPHDGAGPTGTLTALRGELFGTTDSGGTNFLGTVFAIDPSGRERIVHSFNRKHDGVDPSGGVIAIGRTLYGTTLLGGTNENGTIFALDTSGRVRVLYRFKGSSDGIQPAANLVAVNGVLYGTTNFGGAYGLRHCSGGCGTVFAFDLASGRESVLYRFTGGRDGDVPGAIIAARGKFYGVTRAGGITTCGVPNGCGTVYEVSASGSERVLHRFTGKTDGAYPVSLIELNGSLNGVTSNGGASKCSNGTMVVGCGTIFAIDSAAKERTVYSFHGADGAIPSSLIDVNGTLYGTTMRGGRRHHGTVFELNGSGQLTTLFNFGHPRGSAPISVVALNGSYYGLTAEGGYHGCYTFHEVGPCGGVFRLTAAAGSR